jgi:hypothetical protein
MCSNLANAGGSTCPVFLPSDSWRESVAIYSVFAIRAFGPRAGAGLRTGARGLERHEMDAHPFPGPDSDSVIDHHTSPDAAFTVFVGGLPYEVDDLELMDVFSRFGDVSSAAVVMQRSQPSKSRGFG